MRLLHLLTLASLVIASSGCAIDPSDDLEDDADQEPASSSEALTLKGFTEPQLGASEKATILAKYSNLDPGKTVPRDLLANAVLFFHANKTKVKNTSYVSVIDF